MKAFPANFTGQRNEVLNARARRHFVRDFPGPLSIKSVTAGTVAWKCGGRELVVDPESFLVLREGEPYSLEIDSRTPVATFCVFFQHGFVESVRGSMGQAGVEPEAASAPVLARLQRKDDCVARRLRNLADGIGEGGGQLWLDEQCVELASGLLLLDAELSRRVRLLPARRASTRAELFRRVRRGQEFLHAHAADDLDLSAIARQACLSPYHFHRAFTRAFGQTPHEYRTRLRLERARRLLGAGGMTVTEVCQAAGFASAPSFSALFRRRFGVSPSKFGDLDPAGEAASW